MMLMTMVIVLMMIALRARLDEQGIDLDQSKNAKHQFRWQACQEWSPLPGHQESFPTGRSHR